jgi:hypothetical protein
MQDIESTLTGDYENNKDLNRKYYELVIQEAETQCGMTADDPIMQDFQDMVENETQ